ncbi:DNA primase, partial [Patescibacteria group bacterium]|nr:DNA primase [Patescibacteria group bacterium]
MDQLDEIRQKVDIAEFIGEYTPLKKAGRNLKAPCPFHSENKPSFMVSPERQIFKCFGCGVGGDIFKFLMLIEGLEFGEAVRKLAERAGVALKKYRVSPEEEKKKKYFEVNDLATEYYHYLLTQHPAGKKALDYILGRGITLKSLQEFKIGFAPLMWDGVQKYLVDKKKYSPQILEQAGLALPNNRGGYYDRFRGRLMFPLRDYQGNICGFAGRVIPPASDDQAKYINSSETPVYQKSRLLYGLSLTRGQIRKQDQAVVVEGELDLISSYQAGVFNVVAIKGSALTEGQLILLKRYTKNLALALDADFAGNKAAQRGIELADKMGFAIKVVEVKGGKDPDEAAQKDPKGWCAQIKKAVSVYDYLFHFAFSSYDERSAEGKRQIGQFLVPILAKMTDGIVRGHYISLLAQRLRIREEAVVAEVEKVKPEFSSREKQAVSFQSVRQTRR